MNAYIPWENLSKSEKALRRRQAHAAAVTRLIGQQQNLFDALLIEEQVKRGIPAKVEVDATEFEEFLRWRQEYGRG